MSKRFTEKRPSVVEKLTQHGWSVMFYDGECRLCTSVVRFAAKRSGHNLIAFSAMQSNSGHSVLDKLGSSNAHPKRFLMLEEQRTLEGSDAVLRLLDNMEGPWHRLAVALRQVPHPLRDGAYNLIVNSRHRMLPKRRQCMLVGPEKLHRYVV